MYPLLIASWFLNYLKTWCARTNCRVVCAMENGVMENARNHGCKRDVWQLVVIGQSAAATKWVTSDATNWSRTVSVARRLLIAAKKLVENANNHKLKICMQKRNYLDLQTFYHSSTNNKNHLVFHANKIMVTDNFRKILHRLIELIYYNWDYIWQ